uniref:Zinc finger PHD-type domain-containing protein n=1 Tax=Davidia involucrata TaxID=16924 RepID=A0A5B7C1A8_DAVIN
MELEHRSHCHPLFFQREGNAELCQGCGKGISGCAYSCSQPNCSFYLHKACAELPDEFKHPMHHQHPLYLFIKPPYSNGRFQCNVCRYSRDKFAYHCAYCQFDTCISCVLEERKITHKCHNHPLNLVQRPALFHCDACDAEDKDSSYLCSVCPFWIHRGCVSLPSTFKRIDHDHPLTLLYYLSHEYYKSDINCKICAKKVNPSYWVYHCGKCRYVAHVNCATSKTKPPSRR